PWVTYNASGLLPQDRTHVFKVNGEYAWPSGTVLGAALNVHSGTPLSATTGPEGGTTPFYGGLFILERGAAGEPPPSPTSTFAGRTSGRSGRGCRWACTWTSSTSSTS